MWKVWLFSALLIAGLIVSQMLPLLPHDLYEGVREVIGLLTMIGLAFIMIHVGYEFDIDKKHVSQFGWDYVVAMTAAAFPWIFVTLYFVFVMLPQPVWHLWDTWRETLLAGRFAAPTSAGVLFSMLAAAGLSRTWMFHKARVLAIFDDLDTVLLMIPLKIFMIGLAWQMGVVALVILAQLWVAWRWLHRVNLHIRWPYVLGYALIIAASSEFVYLGSVLIDDSVPVHLEVLLPAFVLGCIISRNHSPEKAIREPHEEHAILETPIEQSVALIVSAAFMILVGLNMPPFHGTGDAAEAINHTVTGAQPMPSWGWIAVHVLIVTVLSNLGKMFPAFCYRRHATFHERLALAVGMWPRGEVGAGVLVISLSYGISGPIITVALLSLALNLVLTGLFIIIVKHLLARAESDPKPAAVGVAR